MTAVTIRGLSKLLKLLVQVCDVIGVYGPRIRPFVPTDNQADFDAALAAITAGCAVIRGIDYLHDGIGTNT